MSSAPTPRDTLLTDGTASLYRFRRPEGVAPVAAPPVLLVPSMINRWYVLDLRQGSSVAEHLVQAGLDVFCLDWGAPEDEDRHRTWDDGVRRLDRMLRRVRRETQAQQVTVLGYCMGATVAAVHAALHPELYAGFVNLLGPIDFSHAGLLGQMTDRRWFDGAAVAEAGNVAPLQMQSGFVLLRPTQQLSKWVTVAEKALDPEFRAAFEALEGWANDNVAFPAATYVRYIDELYQRNLLVKGEHAALGRRVDLGRITCPTLTVTASKDTICPPKAALALHETVGAKVRRHLEIPGGHVGAVVGARASKTLYPALAAFMARPGSDARA